jgi:hypothetical protein
MYHTGLTFSKTVSNFCHLLLLFVRIYEIGQLEEVAEIFNETPEEIYEKALLFQDLHEEKFFVVSNDYTIHNTDAADKLFLFITTALNCSSTDEGTLRHLMPKERGNTF